MQTVEIRRKRQNLTKIPNTSTRAHLKMSQNFQLPKLQKTAAPAESNDTLK